MLAPVIDQQIKQPGVKMFLDDPVKKLLINNHWIDAQSGKTFEVVNPTTEQVIARAAEGGKADVDAAVRAARAAFDGPWARLKGGRARGFGLNWFEHFTEVKSVYVKL